MHISRLAEAEAGHLPIFPSSENIFQSSTESEASYGHAVRGSDHRGGKDTNVRHNLVPPPPTTVLPSARPAGRNNRLVMRRPVEPEMTTMAQIEFRNPPTRDAFLALTHG